MTDLEHLTGQALKDIAARLPVLSEDVRREWADAMAAVLRPENSVTLYSMQARHAGELSAVWEQVLNKTGAGANVGAHARPTGIDWENLAYFQLLRTLHSLRARQLMEFLDTLKLEGASRKCVGFLLRQAIDAASPANFAATNPEVIALAQQTASASLQRGVAQFAQDLARGRISTSDETQFEVGRNLAVTAGAVVFENSVMQLIQYQAATDSVSARPLFIVPPFINKFYILDLQPENSLVRYCVEQGITVFMVSWRNVKGTELGQLTWDDYLRQGILTPLEVAREITGATGLNVLGFCVGGTLLTCALAVADQAALKRIKSLTLLASMLDFSDTGEISVFVNETFVRQAEQDYLSGGIMPGGKLFDTFALLRANDLIWYFVVNNYLKGQAPRAFDLLYWNADSTNVPGRLYAYYLRNMYLENTLRVPGALDMLGRPVDLRRLQVPVFAVAARDDHIVPWRTAYASAQLLRGPLTFVLAQSGHIAGIINPPRSARRSYTKGGVIKDNPDAWLDGAESVAGSWWNYWLQWLRSHSGRSKVAKKILGSARYPVVEAAPGRYVRERID